MMAAISAFILAFVSVFCFLSCATGSAVVFTQTPDVVTSLTRSVTLRCGVKDTGVSPGGMVGRDAQTAYNVHHVTSVAVTRTSGEAFDVTVATVSQTDGARSQADQGKLKVTGDVSGKPGEPGYLQLVWSYPSTDQTAEYKCTVTGTTDQGQSVVLSQFLELEVGEPKLADVVSQMQSLDMEVTDLKAQLHNQTTTLQGQVGELKHVERGRVVCGNSKWYTAQYTAQGRYPHSYKSQSFQTAYSRPPIVFVSLVYLDAPAGQTDDTYHFVTVQNVTNDHFTLLCESRGSYIINMMYADWISFSQ